MSRQPSIPPSTSLAEMDLLYFKALDENVNGIVIVNSKGHICFWNKWMEESSRIKSDDALGKSVAELFPDLKDTRIDRAINNTLEKGNAVLLSQALMKDPFPLYSGLKHERPVKQVIYVKPLNLPNNIRYCLVQITDVTTAVQREHQLKEIATNAQYSREAAEELSSLKSGFISTVSHELRTPLTSIRGSLSLLTNQVVGELPAQAKTLIEIAFTNTEHLLSLINDLLDISKIESGKMDFYFAPLELTTFMIRALKANKGYAEQHQVKYQLNATPNDVCFEADEGRLTQVMNNLLSNAAKFSPEGSIVEIDTQCNNDSVRISVTDQGCGIPKDFQHKLFEKFTQARSQDNDKDKGTGLGLSIAKLIVEKHQGEIGFETEEGKGTTFWFEVPLRQF